jgi:photosystem II stability/assembly factor-like uncharacterized protein
VRSLLGTALAAVLLAPAGAAAAEAEQPYLLLDPALDPANASVVYQPGVTGVGRQVRTGLWRSDDAGATFRPLLLGAPTSFDDAKAPSVAVAADGTVLAAEGGAVRRSTDGGASFTDFGSVPGVSSVALGAPPTLTAFAVVERDDADGEGSSRRLAGALLPQPFDCPSNGLPDRGRQGVWRLSAGVWTQVLEGDIRFVLTHPADPRRVYASELCGVHRSDDGGATWRQVASGGPLALVVHPFDPDRLLGSEDFFGMSASDDGGITWSDGSDEAAWALAQPVASAPERVIAARAPADENEPVPLVASDDFGRTWRPLAPPGRVPPNAVLVSPADPQRLYAATLVALLTSADGGASWSAHGRPLDGRGPRVELETRQAMVERTAGGRLPARVRVGLRLDAAQPGFLGSRGRLVIRQRGRARTIGRGQVSFAPGGRATMVITLLPGAGRLVRTAGRIEALLRLTSVDDVGDVAVRWERLTLTG